jgi:MFS transporter, DHA2 family, glioxin efflux transporter
MSRSTPPPPLPNDSKLEANKDKAHHVKSVKEKQSTGSNEPFTTASSTANGVEKPEFLEDDGLATGEKAVDEPQSPPVEYPKGIEMFFIMLALVLSITLCSLDQVSSTAPNFLQNRLLPMHHTPVR